MSVQTMEGMQMFHRLGCGIALPGSAGRADRSQRVVQLSAPLSA
jgi:hypothetical protein